MPRSSDASKPKVGFATHITAGGIAGMAEAVSLTRIHRRVRRPLTLPSSLVAYMPTSGYYQSANAAIEIGFTAWGKLFC